MIEPKRLTLKTPITVGGKEISELAFREPKWGDLFEIPTERAPTHRELAFMASRLCAQTDHAMAQIGMDDLSAVLEIVLSFMPAGLGMPTTPSR